MAKNKKPAKPEATVAAEEPERPGTSGTENLLMTNRRAANKQYLEAQRAETSYKAKKRSATARQHGSDAKKHLKQSTFHMKEFCKCVGKMFKAGPWMVRAWREKRREANEKKTLERNLEKKKKLEEQLSKHEGDKEKEAKP